MGQHKQLLRTFLLALFVVVGAQFVFGKSASALSNIAPDPADTNSPRLYFTVAKSGANYRLDAPRSIVKIYSTTPSGTVTIVNGKYCPENAGTGGIDSWSGGGRGEPITNYSVVQADGNENSTGAVVGTATSWFAPNPCGDPNLTIGYNSLIRSTVEGHTNFYVGYFVAELAAGSAWGFDFDAVTTDSINGFKVEMAPGNIVSFYAGSDRRFAMGEMWISSNTYSNIDLKFAPPCNLSGPTSATIEWYDADIGETNQPVNIPTTLYRYDSSTGAYLDRQDFFMTGGQNAGGALNITVQPNSRYVWNVRDIYSRNGIQFELPYDSFNFAQECGVPKGEASVTGNCETISGYAIDSNRPDLPIRVHIYLDGEAGQGGRMVGDVLANQAYPGQGNHGFSFTIPSSEKSANHVFYAYGISVNSAGATDNNNFPFISGSGSTFGPCVEASCGSISFAPTNPPSLGQNFNVSISFNINIDVILDYQVAFNDGSLNYAGPNPVRGAVNGNSFTVTFNNVSAPAAGEYTGSFVLNGAIAPSGTALTPVVCDFGADADGDGGFDYPSIPVVARPYYKIFGGDAAVGTSFESSTGSCSVNASSPRFIGFNAGFPAGIDNGYAGAGTQLASLAIGQIADHVSGALRPSDPRSPNGLSFANNSGTGTYGGRLNSSHTAGCAPNYFASRRGSNPGAVLNINPAISGDYNRTGSLEITAATPSVGAGNTVTVYVEGDVYINENITYENSSSFSGPSDIPRFTLIVSGNIYVHPRVSALNGLFIAQPVIGGGGLPVTNTGQFITCGYNRGASYSNRLPTDTELNQAAPAGCRSKLTVTGAVIAQTVKTLRTQGNLVNRETLPSPTVRLAYSSVGPMSLGSNPNCINFREPANAEDGAFADNFVCGSSSNNDLGLTYTNSAPYNPPAPPNPRDPFDDMIMGPGKYCVQVNESAEPDGVFMDSGMFNNYICVNEKYALSTSGNYGDYGWQWHTASTVPGKTCIFVRESADPNTWLDNYFCYYENTPLPAPTPAATRAGVEGRGSANIAEEFIYSPEVWLRGLPSAGGLNSFTSLPPVL